MLQQASRHLLHLRSSSSLLGNAAAAAVQHGGLLSGVPPPQQREQPQQQCRGKATDAAAAAAASGVSDGASAAAAESVGELLGQADAILDVSEAATAAAIAAAKGSVWAGTSSFMDIMLWTHDGIGLPWFEAIIATNLLIKALSIPITYTQQRLAPKMQGMREHAERIQELTGRLNKASTASEHMIVRQQLDQAMEDFKRNHPASQRYMSIATPLLAVGQGLVFVSQFSAIATLASNKLPSMTYEGALWFPDLTVPDPWFGLPVMCALTTLAMIRSPSFAASMGSGGQSDVMRKVMLAVSLMFIPAGYYASSAIALLWTINSAVGIAQNAVFANPKVRAALELPPTKGASASSASGSASSGDSVQSLLQRVLGDSAQQPAAATAAAGAGGGRPPPPGTKKAGAAAAPAAPAGIRPGSLAVNYTSARPKRRRS